MIIRAPFSQSINRAMFEFIANGEEYTRLYPNDNFMTNTLVNITDFNAPQGNENLPFSAFIKF